MFSKKAQVELLKLRGWVRGLTVRYWLKKEPFARITLYEIVHWQARWYWKVWDSDMTPIGPFETWMEAGRDCERYQRQVAEKLVNLGSNDPSAVKE